MKQSKQLIELLVVATVFAATVFTASSASAQTQLKPLSEVLNGKDAEMQIVAYSLTRCSALYSNLGALARDNSDKRAEKALSDKAGLFLQTAGRAQRHRDKETGRQVTDKQFIDDISTEVTALAKIYGDQMRSNRVNTGHFISDSIDADSKVCGNLAKALNI